MAGRSSGYAKAYDMNKAVTEHNRCWRLQYSDEVKFHLDTHPCVPEELGGVLEGPRLRASNRTFASLSVAITDRRNANYEKISSSWPRSNPRGFAKWFEGRAPLGRRRRIPGQRLKLRRRRRLKPRSRRFVPAVASRERTFTPLREPVALAEDSLVQVFSGADRPRLEGS